jgi:hypothetical protein
MKIIKLEKQLAEARQQLAENPYDEDLAIKVHELEERLNFAWQDDEEESEGNENA